MEQRVERILSELAVRYELTEDFQRRIRPMVHTVLSDQIDESYRTELLEMVAETCERDLKMRKGSAALKGALEGLVGTIQDLNERLRQMAERAEKAERENKKNGDESDAA